MKGRAEGKKRYFFRAAKCRYWHQADMPTAPIDVLFREAMRTWPKEEVMSANDPMYGPAARCKRTFIELADVRSCINVSGL
jgi:hypothetical protein